MRVSGLGFRGSGISGRGFTVQCRVFGIGALGVLGFLAFRALES